MIKTWRGFKKLPKEVWVIAITTLINRAGTMVYPFLIFYLPRLGLSPGKVGFILALFGIGGIVTAPISGWLSDKIGAARVMKLSLLLSGAILLIYPLAQSFPLVVLFTLIWAITGEAFRPASYAILATIVGEGDDEQTRERSKRAQALSHYAINLGMAIGPVMAGVFVSYNHWKLLFIIDGVTSILAFVYLSIMLRPDKVRSHDSEIHTTDNIIIPVPGLRAIQDRRFLYFLAASIPVLIIFFQELAAMPLFMEQELGLGASSYGLLISLNASLIIFFGLSLNDKTARWSYRKSLTSGAILCALGFGAMAFANGFYFMVITVVIWTFGEMLLLPNMPAYVGSIASKARRGEYMGLYTMILSLSMALAPLIGLSILNRFGGRYLWGFAFVMGCVSAIMASRLTQTGNK